jgi:hypothetical protein
VIERLTGVGYHLGHLDEVTSAAERGIQRIRTAHHLPYSFLAHCGLSVW